MSDRLIGRQQRVFLAAMAQLEAEHGAQWFYNHAVVRAVAGEEPGRGYRQAPDAERRLNPTRVLKELAARGLVLRNPMYGPGASVRLTDAGRRVAAVVAAPDVIETAEERETIAA